MDAAFFGQLGGVDAAVTALASARRGPARSGRRSHVCDMPEAASRRGGAWRPSGRLLEVEPEPVIERNEAQLTDVAAAFGDLADVKVPFLHGQPGRGSAGRRRRPTARPRRRRGRAHRARGAPARRRSGRRLQRRLGEAGVADADGVGAGAHARLLLRADPGRLAVTGADAAWSACTTSASTAPGYHRCCAGCRVPARRPHPRRR